MSRNICVVIQAEADQASVAIANALKGAVADSKLCVSKGQALGKDGKCTWPVNMCNAKPTVDSGFKGRTATLKFEGDAAPGTVGSFDCGPGRYYSTAKTACKLDGKWSNLKAQCKKCTAHAHYAEGCQPPADGVFDSCKHTYQSGLKSGRYIIKENVATYAKTGKKYEAYCLNDNSLGWHLPTRGDGEGGGWEIVHTQSGGLYLVAVQSNRSYMIEACSSPIKQILYEEVCSSPIKQILYEEVCSSPIKQILYDRAVLLIYVDYFSKKAKVNLSLI